jgi:type IV pilus assembly protein PilY1
VTIRTNFANWYSFYRTRMLMMKSATGRAFAGIGSGYRVGFITINPGSPVSSSKYLAIADFDATHKSNWYTKLYAQSAGGLTPLRQALSRAGRHFSGIQTGINSGMTGDPMQYSCQQNFTILTTDGYWNSSAGIQLDGTAIGNHDGNISTTPRPLFDGSTTTTIERVTSVNEFLSTSGCSSGRRRVRATTTVTNTPISPAGSPSSSSNSTTNQTTNTQNSVTTVYFLFSLFSFSSIISAFEKIIFSFILFL